LREFKLKQEIEENEIEKMSRRIEELEKALLKKSKVSFFTMTRSFLGKIFSRNNVELILSIISLAVSCSVATYVFFG